MTDPEQTGTERFEDPNGARSTYARCGDWLDDLERATAPFGLCFSCSDGGGSR